MLSDLIHPIFRIEITYGICKCREIEETQFTDEKWASVNLPLPRIDLQQSLNEYMNEDQVSRCPTCKQFRHRCCGFFFRGEGQTKPPRMLKFFLRFSKRDVPLGGKSR